MRFISIYIYDPDKAVVQINNSRNRDNAPPEYESYVSPARIDQVHAMWSWWKLNLNASK